MRTRRSPRNQEILWRALSGPPTAVPRAVAVADTRPPLKTWEEIQAACGHPMYERKVCVNCGLAKPR